MYQIPLGCLTFVVYISHIVEEGQVCYPQCYQGYQERIPKQIGGSLSSWMQDNEGRVRIPSCDTSIKSRVISDNDTSLSGELKAFHTCFEQTNKVSHCHVTSFPADSVTHISVAEVRYVIMTVNFQKVVSVDVVPG